MSAEHVKDDIRTIPITLTAATANQTIDFTDTIEGIHFENCQSSRTDILRNVLESIDSSETTIVFCQTKDQCINLAKSAMEYKQKIATPLQFTNAKLCELSQFGILYHNADLSRHDRELVEIAVKNQLIRLVFATSTLAVGVNLPISNVVTYSPYKYEIEPWSNAEVRQMIGRAGRRGISSKGRAFFVITSNKEVVAVKKMLKLSETNSQLGIACNKQWFCAVTMCRSNMITVCMSSAC